MHKAQLYTQMVWVSAGQYCNFTDTAVYPEQHEAVAYLEENSSNSSYGEIESLPSSVVLCN